MHLVTARIVLLAAVLLPLTLVAQQPTGESETSRALRYTRLIEGRPLDPGAQPMRAWLLDWVTRSPDVMVMVCNILGPIPSEDDMFFGPELLVQYMAGNAAFQLQNPASRNDPVKPQLAGIASMLRAYQAVLEAKPQVRIALYDEWVREQGSEAFVRERSAAILQNCGGQADPAPAGNAQAAAPAPGPKPEPAAAQPQVPFLGGFLRETRILYPLQVGEWKAQDEKRYDLLTDGVSVRFLNEKDQGWVDLFVYPYGAVTIPQVLDRAEGERQGLIDAWLKEATSVDQDVSALRTLELPMSTDQSDTSAAVATAYSVDLTYPSKGGRLNSAMVVLYQDLYMVKARYSVPESIQTREVVRQSLEQFTSKLLPRLAITSVGACWNPLPVKQLARGTTAPDGHMLTVQESGITVAYAYRDRVLARDPDGPAAEVAMRNGMELLGRLHPGCNGAEPVNPNVEDGMREIRIEYPAPPKTQPPAIRFRSHQREFG